MWITTICVLQLVLRHLVQYLVFHNPVSVRHIKNIQAHRRGECRINLSNHIYICDNMVQNATGNVLAKRGCRYLCNIPCLQQLWSILPKMEPIKPYLYAMYYTSPGPIFHVDSAWDLCQVSWADLCWTAALHIANFPTVGIANSTVKVLSFTSKSWGRRVFVTGVHIAWVTGAMEITAFAS